MILRNLKKVVAVVTTTKAPAVFAVEGIFKGLEKINEYISLNRNNTDSDIESESAYW